MGAGCLRRPGSGEICIGTWEQASLFDQSQGAEKENSQSWYVQSKGVYRWSVAKRFLM